MKESSMQRSRPFMTFVAWLVCQTAMVIAEQPAPVTTLKELRETGFAGRIVSTTGVVTCVEQHHFFIQDETNAMQVQAWNAQQVVDAGDLVVVRGVLVGYGAGIQIRAEDVNRQGKRELPAPELLPASQLLTGSAHCQRVRITGAVHDVVFVRGEVKLLLRSDGVVMHVCWHPAAANAERPDDLLDALVEVTGVAHSGAGADGSPTGGRIPIISRDDLRVIKPGSADIFQRPMRTLSQVRTDVTEHHERLRMTGTVTYASPAGWFYFQDGTGTARGGRSPFLDAPPDLRRPLEANPQVQAGDVIDLVGGVVQDQPGKAMPWLLQCEWRILRKELPPPWEPVSARAILAGNLDGHPVSISGEVVATKVEKDRDGYFLHMVTIDDGGVAFWALVQSRTEMDIPVSAGDYVRLNGVAMTYRRQDGEAERFRINLNSFADIQLTPKPWSIHHLGRWLIGLLVLAAGAIAWIVMLRRQVRLQTAKLRDANDQLARFKQVADSSTDNISMATLDNKPLYMNAAGRAMAGIGADQDLNEITFDQITTPAARDIMFNVGFPHAFQHGHWQAELMMRKLSGEEVPVSFLGLVLRGPDGQPQYISSISRDISERHKLELQLRESNKDLLRFKAIADTMKDLVARSDLNKKTLYMNAAGRSLLGIGLDEHGDSVAFESVYTDESLALFESEGFAHAFQHGYWNAEITMLHRDGTIIPVEFSGLMLSNEDGSPLCMSCIARDLRQRLALERQLRDALDYERELNQLKSAFVNTISHEFRTPLGIILFSSSMMRRFYETFSTGERTAQLDAIDEAVERMNELVEQSLSLGRAEVAAPKKIDFDVNKFSARIIDEVMSATSHRSPINLISPDQLPNANSDETILRTILVNLLGNAVKYSPAGSPITLSIETIGDEKARFLVRDHGPGVNDDDLPKLFTTFYRGKGAEGIPGSGLGLAIVKRCAEALGGTVTVHNATDGGAEFGVELPLFVTPP